MDVCANEMRVLILAAGLGTRLAPITDDKPKSLVPVNGTPILMKQLDNLHRNGNVDAFFDASVIGPLWILRPLMPLLQILADT